LDALGGAGGAGGGARRPIGISPALAKHGQETWYRGNQWPPANNEPPTGTPPVPWATLDIKRFPDLYWNFHSFGFAVIGELVQQQAQIPGGAAFQWNSIPIGPIPDGAATAIELTELRALVEHRAGVLAEAMAQRDGMAEYWRGLLMINRVAHPYNDAMIRIAMRVGQFQSMWYKNQFKRPRPSQLAPDLMPPINPPGHPAFPSGHATEAYLLAGCFKEVMTQANALTPTSAATQVMDPNSFVAFERLAERIARYREVLGAHYPSDSAAGKLLAKDTLTLLKKCPTMTVVFENAAREWCALSAGANAPSGTFLAVKPLPKP
jgi:hypothetical protein